MLVAYHNDLNSVVLRKFTAKEMNLFFSIFALLGESDSNQINLNDLEHFSKIKSITINDLNALLTKTNCLDIVSNGEKIKFEFFNSFHIEENKISVNINPKFYYLFLGYLGDKNGK